MFFPKYKRQTHKNFPCLLSPDMNCIDFPCVNYSRLIAFGNKRENKTHRKISHSTVCYFGQAKNYGGQVK